MKTATVAKIAAHIDVYLEESRTEPVVITRNGKPIAVLVAIQNVQQVKQLGKDPSHSLRSIFKEAHEQLRRGQGIPHEEFWRQVEQSRQGRRKRTVQGNRRD